MNQTCKNCEHWSAVNAQNGIGEYGECRRFIAQMSIPAGVDDVVTEPAWLWAEHDSVFMTGESFYCEQHKARSGA